MENKKLKLYQKDKKYLFDKFYNKKDNNDYYLFMSRLIHNNFINNHILIDGNKRTHRKEMQELINLVSEESLK